MVATIARVPGLYQPQRSKQIVLAGNPNVGKSALFSALTGMEAEVSNFPGTTVDTISGKLGNDDLIDTPGIYGVSSFNDEERLARKVILEAGIVINVVSALSLERDLFLTLQLLDMGKPMILAVNQWDEAQARGMKIDLTALAEALAVPVVHTVAIDRQGITELINSLEKAQAGTPSRLVQAKIETFSKEQVARCHAVLIAEGDELSQADCDVEFISARQEIYRDRRNRINELVQIVVKQVERKKQLSASLGRLVLHPFYGGIIASLVCFFIFYQMLGVFVSGTVVDFTEKKLMRIYCEPAVRRTVALFFPATITVSGKTYDFPLGTLQAGQKAQDFELACRSASAEKIKYDFWSHKNLFSACGNVLSGEYGILTLTLTYLFGLLFPLVLAFYLCLSCLEDSGYLPRLAVLVDRLLSGIGLTGRAIIPLILGLGCVTMATVTTRLLASRRERIIATALLGIAIPCSAQLGIVSGTLARSGGLLAWSVYAVVVAGFLVAAGFFLNKILPGKSSSLMIDLPPMRLPRLSNVIKKTWRKTYSFMYESVPVFALAGLVVTAGQMTGLFSMLIAALSPITTGLLQLPDDPRIPATIVLGLVRRDFAAFGLTDVSLSPVQAVVSMVVITLFVPCIASVAVMIKERGVRIALSIWASSWVLAVCAGAVLARILPWLFNIVRT